jgi:hypothetical protein
MDNAEVKTIEFDYCPNSQSLMLGAKVKLTKDMSVRYENIPFPLPSLIDRPTHPPHPLPPK